MRKIKNSKSQILADGHVNQDINRTSVLEK